MRLLTHNMLASNVKVRARRALRDARVSRSRASRPGSSLLTVASPRTPPTLPRAARLPPQGTTNGFPLKIEVLVKEEREADFHAEFLVNTLAKIDWPAFTTAAESIGVDGLPSAPPEDPSADEPFLRAFHHALMEVHVKEGYLICPDSGRRFPITKGIPNMLLNEDEV